jgi:hypothetical protein
MKHTPGPLNCTNCHAEACICDDEPKRKKAPTVLTGGSRIATDYDLIDGIDRCAKCGTDLECKAQTMIAGRWYCKGCEPVANEQQPAPAPTVAVDQLALLCKRWETKGADTVNFHASARWACNLCAAELRALIGGGK